MSKIAFIGLGIMGRPMAGHLQAGGNQLYLVRHRSPLPAELLEGGAVECASCAEAAPPRDGRPTAQGAGPLFPDLRPRYRDPGDVGLDRAGRRRQ